MEVNPPTTPHGPSKRKSPSSDTNGSPQPSSHKRQRAIEREEPALKLSDSSPNQHITSPGKILESEHEDEESERDTTVSDPLDIEFEGATDDQSHLTGDRNRPLRRNTRTPILVPVEPELSTSDIDDLLSGSEVDLDLEDEDSDSVTKGSPSGRKPSQSEERYYMAMCNIDYYNSLSEPDLRREAIRWMEENSRADPKGTVVYPPPWYIATRFEPPRPRLWIKDFFSGRVRPRQLVNDRLAEMTVAQREKWAREHGMGGYDDEDTE
ncbi:hypothetical protein GE21DRAFT_8674 [Neurospora crassa]|uniref:Uncharacterized protein n=1 Tax=Neurospora crassa (strain ATCC 24698 / 74-OR23-1A / CBS 708.71 / DSM 1257 / FGSC 987) TaxID=367110 RepID=Q7S654_NEUCR|nr:hypothetical protein NCU04706 [Neurospora crassa OR74A]EAA31001.1 hypothetical protein NCU04706 [Neurospora crassa OR74A]KHE83279.1 hypothetical protein GE21DRAFT_8674 [Neurospora crassa]|eukprot:XP_960237.1 hypothetical protein NCU04706 [Neurospora crassa OR74A]